MSLHWAQWQILERQWGTSITLPLWTTGGCSGARKPQNMILTATVINTTGANTKHLIFRSIFDCITILDASPSCFISLQCNVYCKWLWLFDVMHSHSPCLGKKFTQLPFRVHNLVKSYWSCLKAIEQYLLWCGTCSNFPWLSLIFFKVFTNSAGSDFSTVGGIILFVWMRSRLCFSTVLFNTVSMNAADIDSLFIDRPRSRVIINER